VAIFKCYIGCHEYSNLWLLEHQIFTSDVTSLKWFKCWVCAIFGLNECLLVSNALTWQHSLIQHILDVVHIKKNICENLLHTIFGQKNTFKVWQNMQVEGIRQHLWLKQHPINQHKILKLHASCLDNKWIEHLLVEDGFNESSHKLWRFTS
jgi:hypothetical protein